MPNAMTIDGDTMDKIMMHLNGISNNIDKINTKHDALTSRMDALETTMGAMNDATVKAKTDAVEKEEETKRADAAAALAATGTLEDKAKFADVQMKADAAYQAWSKQAPHAVHGETLRDYRIRLLNPIKRHSKVYADSALTLVADDAAFTAIEAAIINDAVTASNTTYEGMAPLRKVTRKTASGHMETRFIGDPAVAWATHMGGATRFGRLNRNPSA